MKLALNAIVYSRHQSKGGNCYTFSIKGSNNDHNPYSVNIFFCLSAHLLSLIIQKYSKLTVII